MIDCKNCGQAFEGNFCPECGQKASTKRFSTRILAKDLVKKLLPVDKGVLFTTRQLFSNPGKMLREYLEGKRMNYTKPLQYLLLTVALSLLFFSQNQFEQGVQAGYAAQSNETAARLSKQMTDFIFAHFSVVFVTIIPFLALFSRMFFRKRDVNYAEQLVVNCFVMAGCTLASMPITLVQRALGENPYEPKNTGFSFVVFFVYMIWAYNGFYQPRNKWLGGLKAIMVFVLAYLVYIIVIGLAVAIGVAVYILLGGK